MQNSTNTLSVAGSASSALPAGSVINLSAKYASQIQQKFTAGSFVDGRFTNKIDFVGAKTVAVYTIGTVGVNDYDRTAKGNRYGDPTEVGDTIQELTMTQDKSFSAVIDKGYSVEQVINKAGQFLSVQSSEVITPMMDAYKLGKIAAGAGKKATAAITAANVISEMSKARAWMLENRVPTTGRTWFVSTDIFNYLIGTDYFKNLEKLGVAAVANGQVGELFGAPVIECPADIMPEKCDFILAHKDAVVTPVKINDTKVHIDPPGISGNLIEARYMYDCFVFDAKKAGIYANIHT